MWKNCPLTAAHLRLAHQSEAEPTAGVAEVLAAESVGGLEELINMHPAPNFIRSDNEPELIAQALRDWCKTSNTTSTAHIEARSPWENGFAESFNGGSRMSSSTPSCSPQHARPNSWLIAGGGSTTRPGHIRPSRGVRPWRQLNQELQHDYDRPLS